MSIPGAARRAALSEWRRVLERFNHSKSYYNQLGLYYDDLRRETPLVKEALRRLDPEELDKRNFRLSRALLLSANKTILPKEEWIPYDEDREYLRPLLEMVNKEWEEKKAWNSQ